MYDILVLCDKTQRRQQMAQIIRDAIGASDLDDIVVLEMPDILAAQRNLRNRNVMMLVVDGDFASGQAFAASIARSPATPQSSLDKIVVMGYNASGYGPLPVGLRECSLNGLAAEVDESLAYMVNQRFPGGVIGT